MNKISDKYTFILLLCVGIFFFLIIMPYLDKKNSKDQYDNFTDLLSNNIRKLDQNICSKQCCKHTQWPIPFNTNDPNIDKNLFKDYIGTNLSCNNGPTGGGCLCVNKKDYEYLSSHGQNITN
jgi:hypothetical protein